MKKILNQFGDKTLIRKESGSLVQQESIKDRIMILPELESLIPALTDDEYRQLETNIKQEGCREALLLWNTTFDKIGQPDNGDAVYVLIDGHNRYGICQRNRIDFKILLRDFPDLEQVKNYMIDNQLGRRNLTPERMAYLRGLKYLTMKRQAGRPAQSGSESSLTRSEDSPAETKQAPRTDQLLADQFQVSPKSIRLDARYAKGIDKLDEPLKKKVLGRTVKVNKSDIIALGDSSVQMELIKTVEEITSQNPKQAALSDSSTPDDLRSPLAITLDKVRAMAKTLAYPTNEQEGIRLQDQCRQMRDLLENVLSELAPKTVWMKPD
ncbi:MAG: hypothetical protein LH609_21795 [Rudanella sp.]|nr:hypothetical protein [Rudanella sp.]